MRGAFRASEDYFEFREVGTFRCQHKHEMVLCVAVIVPLFLVLTMFASWLASFNIFGLYLPSFLIFMVGVVIICMGVFNMVTSGEVFRYDANGTEFLITDGKGERTTIFYADVLSVSYKTKKLFFRERGYTVTIETKYRSYVYEYIYSKNKLWKDPSGSPFHIIEERAELLRKEGEKK